MRDTNPRKMKVVVIGSRGFLGRKFMGILKDRFTTYGIDTNVDIKNRKKLRKYFEKIHPDIVIHTAGITDVLECEQYKKEAQKTNVQGTWNIAMLCKEYKVRLVYISTDYVFDGKKGGYTEKCIPCPINAYGRTKLMAEKIIEQNLNDFIICRTSSFYGFSKGKNRAVAVYRIIDGLKRGTIVELPVDQIASPTLIDDLVVAVIRLIKIGFRGVVNIVGPDSISRYHYGKKIAEVFGYEVKLVKKSTRKELKIDHLRPHNVSLNSRKLIELGIIMHGVDRGLRVMKRQIKKHSS